MRKRGRIVLITFVLAVLGVALWEVNGEPRYHWRSLSSWLGEYGAGPRDYKPSPKADEALRHIGPKAVPYLLKLLHETNSSSTLKFSRKSAPPKTPTNVVYWGTGPRPFTNSGAQTPWMKLVEKHTPFRVERVTVPASWSHWKAYVAFQTLGPAGKSAIPDLVKLAHDANGNSIYPNIQVMKTLEWVASVAANSEPYLTADNRVRGGFRFAHPVLFTDGEIAAWSLAAIGADAVPSLMELLADPSPRLKQRAAEALGMTGGAAEPAVPDLVRMLKSPAFEVRQRAADALGWIGRHPELAVPALIDALKDPNVGGVDYYAAESLGRFGERATSAIPALLVNFKAPDYGTRQAAALALSQISRETTAREVIPELIRNLEGYSARSHNMELITLSQMTNEPDLVIPALITALDDNEQIVRGNAANSLGWFGPQAKAAVPRIISMLTKPDPPYIHETESNALDKIDPAWRNSR